MKFKTLKPSQKLKHTLQSSHRLFTTTTTTTPPQHSTQPLTKPQLSSLVLNQYTKNAKFTNLLQNVTALPSVLLTACHNLTTPPQSSDLYASVSKKFSIPELGLELLANRFDVEACCFKMVPSRRKGEFLTLPNLKLKVLIEAIRMVLEVVYDERFVTFVYGGRVGMGRHTAVRYLKNTVENPSWWFGVGFCRDWFDARRVEKLCLFMERKIDDVVLIGLVKRLFECGVVRVELGGGWLGRGFPQECGLSSILVNVYFDGFDKEMQELRLRMNREGRRIGSDELVGAENAFYKPLKVYAVRYLDEILVVTSGSKVLTMDLKNKVLKYLEGDLELKVDEMKTVIHSAMSEKIDFMGMELQAVPPSVLRPPMSEKAVRARKKYLRQKEVRLQELRNARERNRKVLGMKIFKHVFKKLKQSNGFKFECQIENEVREVFRTWADETVEEFLGNLEERWNWHRMLTGGNFLGLRHIRQQLPSELVESYDRFQEQVEKHLTPVKAKKALEEEERRIEEAEEQKYADRTVDDLTRLCIKVDAPIKLVRKAIKMAGVTNSLGRPRPIKLLMALEDTDIIKWYAGVGKRWLDYFCCCHNFKMVKTVVTYHLRFSCILTLAEKHESTKREAIRHYTKDLKISAMDGKEEVYFPTEREVKMLGERNLSDPKPVDGTLTLAMVRLASDEHPHSCAAHFCDRTDTITCRTRLLQNRINVNPSDEEKWVPGMGAIHESLNRKCYALCADHLHDLYMGNITLQDIDCTSFVDVD